MGREVGEGGTSEQGEMCVCAWVSVHICMSVYTERGDHPLRLLVRHSGFYSPLSYYSIGISLKDKDRLG